MAKPIRNTPILKGKDAHNFLLNLFDSIEKLDDPALKTTRLLERERMAKKYQLLKTISINSL